MHKGFARKIIFLDVDGVINLSPERFQSFNKNALAQLQRIIDSTGAKIVVSSSWRTSNTERMKSSLIGNGFTKELWSSVIGITERGYNYVIKGSNFPLVRGNEIKHYVDTRIRYPWHTQPELSEIYTKRNEDGSFKIMDSNEKGVDFQYVILDDDTDMLLEQKDNFLRTFQTTGITERIANKAIKILNSIDK